MRHHLLVTTSLKGHRPGCPEFSERITSIALEYMMLVTKYTETNMTACAVAICVQRFDDSRLCNSHYVSHFAAFFIVIGA
jgi:hypothetical protein